MGVRREARVGSEAVADYKYDIGDRVCIISMKKSGTIIRQTYQFPGQKAYQIELDDGGVMFATQRQLGPMALCTDEQTSFEFMKESEMHDGPGWLEMSAAVAAAAVIVAVIAFTRRRHAGAFVPV